MTYSASQIWKGSYFWVCTSHWLQNFQCRSMLTTPIGVTARVTVCSRTGAHLEITYFLYGPARYQKSLQIWLTWHISTSKITFKDNGIKESVSDKHTKNISAGPNLTRAGGLSNGGQRSCMSDTSCNGNKHRHDRGKNSRTGVSVPRVFVIVREQRRRCQSSSGTHAILMDSASGTGF